MGNERLKEISMEIIKLNDPLIVMNYISSLNKSDIHLFLNYIKSSKYKEMNIYTALMSFSRDYLVSINCPLPANNELGKEVARAPRKI